jgi:hypothetical protein
VRRRRQWGRGRETEFLSGWAWGHECGYWLGWIGGASASKCQDEAEGDRVELHGVGTVPIGQLAEVGLLTSRVAGRRDSNCSDSRLILLIVGSDSRYGVCEDQSPLWICQKQTMLKIRVC